MIAGVRRRLAGIDTAKQHVQVRCDDIGDVVFAHGAPGFALRLTAAHASLFVIILPLIKAHLPVNVLA